MSTSDDLAKQCLANLAAWATENLSAPTAAAPSAAPSAARVAPRSAAVSFTRLKEVEFPEGAPTVPISSRIPTDPAGDSVKDEFTVPGRDEKWHLQDLLVIDNAEAYSVLVVGQPPGYEHKDESPALMNFGTGEMSSGDTIKVTVAGKTFHPPTRLTTSLTMWAAYDEKRRALILRSSWTKAGGVYQALARGEVDDGELENFSKLIERWWPGSAQSTA